MLNHKNKLPLTLFNITWTLLLSLHNTRYLVRLNEVYDPKRFRLNKAAGVIAKPRSLFNLCLPLSHQSSYSLPPVHCFTEQKCIHKPHCAHLPLSTRSRLERVLCEVCLQLHERQDLDAHQPYSNYFLFNASINWKYLT